MTINLINHVIHHYYKPSWPQEHQILDWLLQHSLDVVHSYETQKQRLLDKAQVFKANNKTSIGKEDYKDM